MTWPCSRSARQDPSVTCGRRQPDAALAAMDRIKLLLD